VPPLEKAAGVELQEEHVRIRRDLIDHAAAKSNQVHGEMVVSALLNVDGIDIRGSKSGTPHDLSERLNPTMFVCSVCSSIADVENSLAQYDSTTTADGMLNKRCILE
jgi:hypothetical protein